MGIRARGTCAKNFDPLQQTAWSLQTIRSGPLLANTQGVKRGWVNKTTYTIPVPPLTVFVSPNGRSSFLFLGADLQPSWLLGRIQLRIQDVLLR